MNEYTGIIITKSGTPPFGLPKPDLRIRTRIRERFILKKNLKKLLGPTDHEFKLSYHGGIK